MVNDPDHWQHLKPPLAPSAPEVELFRHHVQGLQPVYLLGITQALLPLCDAAVDLYPRVASKPVIQADWNELRGLDAGGIIGDGVINLVGTSLVGRLLPQCQRLVCRVFLKKFPGMKYATHFPREFPGASLIIPTQPGIAIVVWDNKK